MSPETASWLAPPVGSHRSGRHLASFGVQSPSSSALECLGKNCSPTGIKMAGRLGSDTARWDNQFCPQWCMVKPDVTWWNHMKRLWWCTDSSNLQPLQAQRSLAECENPPKDFCVSSFQSHLPAIHPSSPKPSILAVGSQNSAHSICIDMYRSFPKLWKHCVLDLTCFLQQSSHCFFPPGNFSVSGRVSFSVASGHLLRSYWKWPSRNSWFTHQKWWIFMWSFHSYFDITRG